MNENLRVLLYCKVDMQVRANDSAFCMWKWHEQEIQCYRSLWYKGVATFSSGGDTTGWDFRFSVILQNIRFA